MVKSAMSEVRSKGEGVEVVNKMEVPSRSLRGPLLLAKMVIDALDKQKQVSL